MVRSTANYVFDIPEDEIYNVRAYIRSVGGEVHIKRDYNDRRNNCDLKRCVHCDTGYVIPPARTRCPSCQKGSESKHSASPSTSTSSRSRSSAVPSSSSSKLCEACGRKEKAPNAIKYCLDCKDPKNRPSSSASSKEAGRSTTTKSNDKCEGCGRRDKASGAIKYCFDCKDPKNRPSNSGSKQQTSTKSKQKMCVGKDRKKGCPWENPVAEGKRIYCGHCCK